MEGREKDDFFLIKHNNIPYVSLLQATSCAIREDKEEEKEDNEPEEDGDKTTTSWPVSRRTGR